MKWRDRKNRDCHNRQRLIPLNIFKLYHYLAPASVRYHDGDEAPRMITDWAAVASAAAYAILARRCDPAPPSQTVACV